MASRKDMLFKVIVYGNKDKVKNWTSGMDYIFQMKIVRAKDFSVSVMKKVSTSKEIS